MTVNTACASGLSSVIQGVRYIQQNQADLIIAGGVEDSYNPLTVNSSLRMQAMTSKPYDQSSQASRPFDKRRSGFVLGEGSGVLLIEEYNHAINRGATIYGEILGIGESSDGFHLVKPDHSGEGQVSAMKNALQSSNVHPKDINFVDCHATSTPTGDEIEANSIKTVFGNYSPLVTANKSAIGHTLGAAGVIELIFALKALNSGILPKIQNLEEP